MKTKSLQIGKAMSAALFVLLLSVVGMKNAFAQNQVATLQHNDSITGVFYGQNAFVSAHNAAVNGDIITLSSGTFNNCQITKSVTIHGAGCVYDSITQKMPTIISGVVYVNRNNLCVEGVWFTGSIKTNNGNYSNYSFIKCNINEINGAYSNYYYSNWQFINCIIKQFGTGPTIYFHGMSIINSVVRFVGYHHTDITMPTIINNSVVLFNDEQTINNINAYNSIIAVDSNHAVSNCTFINCIGIETGETLLFEGQTTQNIMEFDSYDDVFESFIGEISYDNIYQLKEEIATSFLGNNSTEVGIFGGMMPYNPRPSYMIMKHAMWLHVLRLTAN